MLPRTLKLLTASTAFIAAASVSHAQSTATGPVTIASGSTVSVGTGPAIAIDNTDPTSNTVIINTGASVRSPSATVFDNANAANGAATIINHGSIINLADGKAIDLSSMTDRVTITNTGLVSGSITMGGNINTLTSTGTTRGDIHGGSNNDTFTFTGASHTGNILLQGGNNTATISSSTITGGITGGTGNDAIHISNSTVTTEIGLASGTDTLFATNSSIGNITSGAGANASLVLTNTSVGSIVDAGTNDNDTLTLGGNRTFTTGGNIQGIETITFNTNAVINHNLVNTNSITVNAGKSVDVNKDFSLGSALNNAGNLNINPGHIVQAATYNGTGGNLGIMVSNSTTAGLLRLTAGTVSAPSVTIALGANAGYIASGTTITIIDGAGVTPATNAVLLNKNTGVYRFTTQVSGTNSNDIELNIGRVATDSVVEGSNNKAVAESLEKLAASTNADIVKIQSLVGQQADAAGVQRVVESLAPSIDGAGIASLNISVDTANQVSERLASLRSGTGIATGDGYYDRHSWIQGFGSSVKQDDKGANRGYDSVGGGVSGGLDTETLINGYTTGLAVTYGNSKVDSNASSDASTKINSYMASLYASKVFAGGQFVNAQVGGGINEYKTERNVIGIGKAEGETEGYQGTAKIETGHDIPVGNFTFTPLASVQYTYLDIDSYTETGIGGAGLMVNPDALSAVDTGLGFQLAYAFPLENGGTLKPSVRAKYIYRLGDTNMATTNNFIGGGTAFQTAGVESDRSSVNLGAGLTLTTLHGTDLSLNYDADIRSSLIGHTGQLKARTAF